MGIQESYNGVTAFIVTFSRFDLTITITNHKTIASCTGPMQDYLSQQ